jgi:hypothetical protein
VISFEVIKDQTEAHRAELYREAAIERLADQASAGRTTFRTRLAHALRTLAERLDHASCVPCESGAASSVHV